MKKKITTEESNTFGSILNYILGVKTADAWSEGVDANGNATANPSNPIEYLQKRIGLGVPEYYNSKNYKEQPKDYTEMYKTPAVSKFNNELNIASSTLKIPPEILAASMMVESEGKKNAIGDKSIGGSFGLLQVNSQNLSSLKKQFKKEFGRDYRASSEQDQLLLGGLHYKNLIPDVLQKGFTTWEGLLGSYNAGARGYKEWTQGLRPNSTVGKHIEKVNIQLKKWGFPPLNTYKLNQ